MITKEMKERWKKAAREYCWPNFPSFREMEEDPRILVAGHGSYYVDVDGREILDGFAGLQNCQIGHGRREVAEAVYKQMLELEFAPAVINILTPPVVELAQKMTEVMPKCLRRTFFVNDGSEAVEAALKIAKQYQWERGFRKRYKTVSRRGAYHGVTMGALSVSGHTWFRSPMEPLMPGSVHVAPPFCYRCDLGLSYPSCDLQCVQLTERIIQWEDPETVACMIIEPVMGAQMGYAVPPDGYLEGLREICDRYGIILIIDEVLVGFARSGRWFAHQHWDVEPDIMTTAKGLSSGYLPLGAASVRPEIAAPFMGPESKGDFRHGHTYGGHTTSCAAALANIEIIQREKLPERAETMGKYIRERIRAMFDKHPVMGDLRGMGMLFGIELVADRETRAFLPKEKEVGDWIRRRCYDLGLVLRAAGDVVILAPPLTMTREEADRMCDIMDRAIGEAEQELDTIQLQEAEM